MDKRPLVATSPARPQPDPGRLRSAAVEADTRPVRYLKNLYLIRTGFSAFWVARPGP
jgi:hypothetical protein